jgi:hypothetical protein
MSTSGISSNMFTNLQQEFQSHAAQGHHPHHGSGGSQQSQSRASLTPCGEVA